MSIQQDFKDVFEILKKYGIPDGLLNELISLKKAVEVTACIVCKDDVGNHYKEGEWYCSDCYHKL